jgi:hypothetical protein
MGDLLFGVWRLSLALEGPAVVGIHSSVSRIVFFVLIVGAWASQQYLRPKPPARVQFNREQLQMPVPVMAADQAVCLAGIVVLFT